MAVAAAAAAEAAIALATAEVVTLLPWTYWARPHLQGRKGGQVLSELVIEEAFDLQRQKYTTGFDEALAWTHFMHICHAHAAA